jgi:acetyl esterase
MIDPTLKPFLDEWTSRWAELPPQASSPERRAHFEHIARAMAAPFPSGVDGGTNLQIPTQRGFTRVRVFRPLRARGHTPVVVFAHGGGFRQGSPETHAELTATLCARTGATVLSVDYALAPEHPFPLALLEVRDVLRWVRRHGAEMGLDGDRLCVAGDSAGANLVAAACLMLRGTPDAPQGQILVYPLLDFALDRDSHRAFADGPALTVAGLAADMALYCPDPALRQLELAAPLQALHCRGLPPTFVGVAQCDPLRDEGLAYASRLRADGVDVTLDEGRGLTHSYLRAISSCEPAAQVMTGLCDWLTRLNRRPTEAL